jgi:hypothetical protein
MRADQNKIEKLAAAIAHAEGFGVPGEATKNNNPGNLRHSHLSMGTDEKGFCVFPTPETGWNALKYDLERKVEGHSLTILRSTSTLLELAQVWAPKSDQNDPYQYCALLCATLNKNLMWHATRDTPLSEFCLPENKT